MAYQNIGQILALSKTQSEAGLDVIPFPKLEGKLAQIDPEGVAEYNAKVEEWVARLFVEIEKAITEIGR